MKDYDVYELRDSEAEVIDEAFAKVFGLERCNWAQTYDTDAVTDFLLALEGKRRIWDWTIHYRNWGSGSYPYEASVDSRHWHGFRKTGVIGYGYSPYACHAIMTAAIEWDQERRRVARDKWAEKRQKVRQSIAPMPMNHA